MNDFIRSTTLLLVLLNPFLVVVYLIDVMQKLDRRQFRHVRFRARLIAGAVFCCFAILGDAIFSEIMQVNFTSFQIFSGLVFLLIGFQFVFRGPTSIEILRGESEHKEVEQLCRSQGISYIFKDSYIDERNCQALVQDAEPQSLGSTELGRIIAACNGFVQGTTLQTPTTGYHTMDESSSMASSDAFSRLLLILAGLD